jgi:uncharacterized protein DUF6982
MGPVKVVIRYADGRLVKGYTNDFSANKPFLHVSAGPNDTGAVIQVKELKAVFFVKDFMGNPEHNESNTFDGQKPSGRKIEVTFNDNEVIVGTTLGYDPGRLGFFLVPADPESNNIRVFAVNGAVRNFRYL